MKQRTGRKLLSFLLTLVMVVGLMLGVGLTAYAESATWGASFTSDGGTIDGGVTVSADMALTIPEGKTLTVNGGIDANGHTVTVAGTGTLIVKGTNGTSVVTDGGDAITGGTGSSVSITVNSGSFKATGGAADNPGKAVSGNVTIAQGSTSTIEESADNNSWTCRLACDVRRMTDSLLHKVQLYKARLLG